MLFSEISVIIAPHFMSREKLSMLPDQYYLLGVKQDLACVELLVQEIP